MFDIAKTNSNEWRQAVWQMNVDRRSPTMHNSCLFWPAVHPSGFSKGWDLAKFRARFSQRSQFQCIPQVPVLSSVSHQLRALSEGEEYLRFDVTDHQQFRCLNYILGFSFLRIWKRNNKQIIYLRRSARDSRFLYFRSWDHLWFRHLSARTESVSVDNPRAVETGPARWRSSTRIQIAAWPSQFAEIDDGSAHRRANVLTLERFRSPWIAALKEVSALDARESQQIPETETRKIEVLWLHVRLLVVFSVPLLPAGVVPFVRVHVVRPWSRREGKTTSRSDCTNFLLVDSHGIQIRSILLFEQPISGVAERSLLPANENFDNRWLAAEW